jgi:hypothetical protein
VKAKIGLLGAAAMLALAIAASAAAADPSLGIERKSRLDGGVITIVFEYSCDWTSAALLIDVRQDRRGVAGTTVSTDVVCDGTTNTLAVEVFGEGDGGQPAPFKHGPATVDAELVGCSPECGLSLPVAREIRITG